MADQKENPPPELYPTTSNARVETLLENFNNSSKSLFKQRKTVMGFKDFLCLVQKNPRGMTRNSASYLRDAFDHFGKNGERFKIFDIGTERNIPIIGGEQVQRDFYNILQAFVRQGAANKLVMLHGPNGSAKTSTIESIAHAMQIYSEQEEGAVYRFNWVFPNDRSAAPKVKGESGPIGFGKSFDNESQPSSWALLDESDIASKLVSEFKENPVYLIPMPQREQWLRAWIAEKEGCAPSEVELPPHILLGGLSKKNQLIYENLLNAYEGDSSKVLRHIQVERFFYSRQYRVGISTVEPQMSVDAQEKQLTMDKNLANLPSVLQNIRFYEAQGELMEANRGILEFSDLLKRPVETFKYLLSTVERGMISLPSATALLDMVFVATSNEKHLDAFKTIPDFSSFRGRFEFIKVPYLLRPSMEEKIYDPDRKAIAKSYEIVPHTVELLAIWAVMTRLKQPDPEVFDSQVRGLVAKLEPRNKIRLYEKQALQGIKPIEEHLLQELRPKIIDESTGSVVYEGRFGASPREVRQILYRAAQSCKDNMLSPQDVFRELELLVKDRSVYDFLQFEPRGKYHDAALFVKLIQDEFADIFERELLTSLTLVEEHQYEILLQRYVENIVAEIKKEKIYNPKTSSYEPANQALMKDLEKILGVSGSVEKHRESVLARIAAWKIDNPSLKIDIPSIFPDFVVKVQDHYFEEKSKVIEAAQKAMLAIGTEMENQLGDQERDLARTGYHQLQLRYGYSERAARSSLKFLIANRRARIKK
jgi:serine protein kinase